MPSNKIFYCCEQGKDGSPICVQRRSARMLYAASAVTYPVSDVLFYELVTLNYSCTTLCEKGNNHLLAAPLKSACSIVKPISLQTERRLFLRVSQSDNNSAVCFA